MSVCVHTTRISCATHTRGDSGARMYHRSISVPVFTLCVCILCISNQCLTAVAAEPNVVQQANQACTHTHTQCTFAGPPMRGRRVYYLCPHSLHRRETAQISCYLIGQFDLYAETGLSADCERTLAVCRAVKRGASVQACHVHASVYQCTLGPMGAEDCSRCSGLFCLPLCGRWLYGRV